MTEMAKVVGTEKLPTQNTEARITEMLNAFHLGYSGGNCCWILEDGKKLFTINVNRWDGREVDSTVRSHVIRGLSRIFEECGTKDVIIAVT